MTCDELNKRYFEWMCRYVYDKRYSKTSFKKLLYHLYETPFDYVIDMDGNRYADGIDFRYRFGYECNFSNSMIATFLDNRPCSILEMMIALAVRCEEHIAEDPEIGDRTGQWFWNMIVSLGLGSMTDARYDQEYIDAVIERFLNREYDRNGKGGLFTVEHCRYDMRNIEIWYQMNLYLEATL